MTLVLQADNDTHLQHAGRLLTLGGIVAVPTETVYGLAADATNTDAIRKVYEAKQRPQQHPAIVHIGSIEQLPDWVSELPDVAYQLAEQFWPGPLTLLLKRHPRVSPLITGGSHSIAVRLPAQMQLQRLLKQQRLGVIAPSANMHQQLSPTTSAHVLEQLEGKIDAVLDGGRCQVGIESTIVDLRDIDNGIQILRPGPVTARQIGDVLNQKVHAPAEHDVAVAGNMARHYQPKAQLRWLHNPEEAKGGVILVRKVRQDWPAGQQELGATPAQYAHALYYALHQLDQQQQTTIWLEPLPEGEEWQALRNRLDRATQ
ncbi:threonylcarbamoyl-AMP synthase [Pseudidiomarina sp. 1APP75-27a]|uniref:L-threonylcarbamoyladenylate synthase n=1 Tax=Pseudidiomarina terrestris TaxID=2820060 RepID=UPI002B05584A|nr:L-threonylcarbamoyladenylate synthase [Pseudidiomarina sp. 1APP75-27a]MEA3586880.1 threonylcarbamoyl-AMP synthase [Pseudidiomarina sp. 1APP75-27a]